MADLAELYARDPLSLTREDLAVMVLDLREKRVQFNLGDKAAAKAPKPGDKPKMDLGAILDLKDLGL